MTFLRNRIRWLASQPRLWLPLAAAFAGLLVLGWRGGALLWVHFDRSRAERALAEYDFTEGRRRLERCVRFCPGDLDLRLLAARTARRDGDLDTARRHLDAYYREAGRQPSDAAALERQLATAQQGGVHEVVKDLLEAIEIHHPQTELILESLAMGCVSNYQLGEARFWIDELQERSPKNAIGRLLKAQTTDTQGHREKAISLLRELTADYPKYYKARQSLADILFKSQRYREAIEEYQALLQQRPEELMPLLGLASSYDRLGDSGAASLMQQLRERFPDNSEALLECGRHFLGRGNPAEAEPIFRKAAEMAPFDHDVHREFAVCLEQLGKSEESKQHLERFRQIEADLILLEKTLDELAKRPNDSGLRRKAGEICLRNGQQSEGLRWLYGTLDHVPDDRLTHQMLADYWTAHGDTRRAADHLRQAGGVPAPGSFR